MSAESPHRLRRRHDRNFPKALERQQVSIAGDNKIGLGRERAGEHVIVIGIARNPFGELASGDAVSQASVVAHELVCTESGIRDGFGELPAMQDFGEFIEQHVAGEDLDFVFSSKLDQSCGDALP